MQGTKLPGAKLWIAGVSTLAILLGCETEPVKEQAANSNASTYPAESKAKGDQAKLVTQGQVARQDATHAQATPPAAPAESAVFGEGGLVAPAAPAAEVDQLAGAAQGAPAMGLYPTTGGEAYRQRGDYFAQPVPGEGENYIATSDSAVKQVAVEQTSTFSIDVDTGAYSNVRR